ncbi:unnamed protein product [Prunus armeniaca]|uniref:Uncharacterized protein n=1 Tax=Prunus armeniaca TaxID=36596 RepID=A0A6J5XEJ7_PRUAR|nr:unnamed protein product [Prunus armeniaca]
MHVQTLLETGFQQSVFGLLITHGITRNRLLHRRKIYRFAEELCRPRSLSLKAVSYTLIFILVTQNREKVSSGKGSLTKEATLMNESRSNSGLELNQELFMLRQRSGGSSFGRLLEIVCPLLSVELLRYPLLSSLVSIVLLAPLWTAIRKESGKKRLRLFHAKSHISTQSLDQEDPKRPHRTGKKKKITALRVTAPHLCHCLAWANYIPHSGKQPGIESVSDPPDRSRDDSVPSLNGYSRMAPETRTKVGYREKIG